MNPISKSKTPSVFKIFILFFLFPLLSNGQTFEKDSLYYTSRKESVKYLSMSNASFAAGLIFHGAGAASLLFSQGSTALISAGVIAIVVGAICVVDSYILKRKAKRKLLRTQN